MEALTTRIQAVLTKGQELPAPQIPQLRCANILLFPKLREIMTASKMGFLDVVALTMQLVSI